MQRRKWDANTKAIIVIEGLPYSTLIAIQLQQFVRDAIFEPRPQKSPGRSVPDHPGAPIRTEAG
jgi:hypothetical protein